MIGAPFALSGLPREPTRSYIAGAVGVLANSLSGDRLGRLIRRLPGLAALGSLRLKARYPAAPRAFIVTPCRARRARRANSLTRAQARERRGQATRNNTLSIGNLAPR